MIEVKNHDLEGIEQTYFADPNRAQAELLEYQIDLACTHAVTTAILNAFSGIVLILNQYRQVVALNDSFLRTLGIADPRDALGLRPGEAVSCSRVKTAPNGCGTGKACITCGAVLSIVASQRLSRPIERECLILRQTEDKEEPLEFLVRASPILVDGSEFTIVTILDISEKKRALAIERMFIHDLLNCVQGLKGISEIISMEKGTAQSQEIAQIGELTDYLCEMANSHRDLLLMEAGDFQSTLKDVSIADIIQKVEKMLSFSSAAHHKSLVIEPPVPDVHIMTDDVLLIRVLVNMVKNALEATTKGSAAKLRCEIADHTLVVSTWNAQEIPTHTALRVFQRYFSTKTGNGHGLGTYSMKLIGEKYLGGKVSFQTSAEGTIFSLTLPV